MSEHAFHHALLSSAQKLNPLRTAVAHPVQPHVLEAVNDAARAQLIIPILIGPIPRIRTAAQAAHIDLSAWELVDAEHSHDAAQKAVAYAASDRADALMKGSLHSDELLHAAVAGTPNIRTGRRLSHTYVLDTPDYPKPLFITDAAVNIAPDLDIKADICRNTIDLWRVLFGTERRPKVALLAAVETIHASMPATLDAAALCKMAERGQIEGALLDGPLALDNAINALAAKEKNLTSSVAGDADILVVPNIEAGNMLAKEMTFLGHADAAGIVLGARVPIIFTSRADSVQTRLLSCALAVLMSAAKQEGLWK